MVDLISIIVPVYNVEQYLSRCLESLLSQTYKNIEIILVNDGSTDSSGILCDEYAGRDTRIRVVHKQNGGLSSARNTGISIAKGKYIGFVDSDDWITDDAYEYLYNLLIKFDADLSIAGFVRCSSESECEIIDSKRGDFNVNLYSQSEYMKKFMKIDSQTIEYYAWNKLYKKTLLQEQQYPVGLTAEDVVGTFRYLLRANKIVQSDKVTNFYYINPNSITADFNIKKAKDLISIWDIVVAESQSSTLFKPWAILNRARIDFTILFHIALSNDYNNLIKEQVFINDLLSGLKKNKRFLLDSNMPYNRKLFMLIFVANYKTASKIINMINKFLRR
ncbi:MAG: glycosyltransferase family 2 protein [Kluyvera sp.]|uniref:glycosyltransferase family 2 protein n=1 Tax=Kluyvera sp. TaxID=1538228 RepID=UPI003F3B1AC5